jgi:hypothetical protein
MIDRDIYQGRWKVKTLMLPRVGIWAGSRTSFLLQSVAACIAFVCRGWHSTVKTRKHHTTDHVTPSGEQAASTGALLVESDIRGGVRGIMP